MTPRPAARILGAMRRLAARLSARLPGGGAAWLAGSLALAGCWASHEPGAAARSDAGADARVARDASLDAPRDASFPRDVPAPRDAGHDASACEGAFEEIPLHACLFEATGALPAGLPSSIRLAYSACLCDARTCLAHVEGGAIVLDTFSCPETSDCDECDDELLCPVPALPEGDYELRLDGRALATVPVRPRMPVTVARPTCWGLQDELPEGLACAWPGAAVPSVGELCHRELEDVGTFVRIELRYAAPPCEPPGECRAELDGRTVRVTGTRLPCDPSCAGEPATLHALHCVSPPLREGDYEIVAPGTPELRSPLRVRDVFTPGATRCVPRPP